MELSQRLTAVARYVKPGSKVADIGSDHAFLPIHLIQSGKSASVIAGEVNRGPLEMARKNVDQTGFSKQIELRLGDGLSVIEDGEVDTVCISGMGGTLITSILDAGIERLSSVQQLVLQPNVAEKQARKWLYDHGWELVGETILKEEGIIYEVFSAVRGNAKAPYQSQQWPLEQWFELGPFLWSEKSPIYKEKWEREWGNTKRVLSDLKRAKSTEIETKRMELEDRLKWIEEVLTCMQTVRP
ncbi:tRNA (adenine(22)-N(1))-methyltransferase [Ammoniphilus oxalaticus]|nr:class I SAM-dependent methyltransferase [Ammoniphilus oxalaticus]